MITSLALSSTTITATMLLILITALAGFALYQYLQCYEQVASDEILIVTGSGETRYIRDGGTLVWPIVQQAHRLSLRPISRHLKIDNAPIKNRQRLDLDADCTLAVSTDPDRLANAAQRLVGLNETRRDQTIDQVIVGQLRNTAAQHAAEQIDRDPQTFTQKCRQSCASDLEALGLTIQDFSLDNIVTHQGSSTT